MITKKAAARRARILATAVRWLYGTPIWAGSGIGFLAWKIGQAVYFPLRQKAVWCSGFTADRGFE
jgi:hypothetical protein